MGLDMYIFVEYRPAGKNEWCLYIDKKRKLSRRYEKYYDVDKEDLEEPYMFYCRKTYSVTGYFSDDRRFHYTFHKQKPRTKIMRKKRSAEKKEEDGYVRTGEHMVTLEKFFEIMDECKVKQLERSKGNCKRDDGGVFCAEKIKESTHEYGYDCVIRG
eukprot:480048_1